MHWVYLSVAVGLAFAVAGGLLAFRLIAAGSLLGLSGVAGELGKDRATYGYVVLAAAVLFGGPAFWLGRKTRLLWASAVTDPLTCVPNRRYFDLRLREEFERARSAAMPLSLLMVDVDYLRGINNRCGRDAGDEALRLLAEVIRSTCRSRDLTARFDGDKFAVILPRTRAAEALVVAERIRTTLALRWMASSEHQGSAKLSVSIGVADASSGAPTLLENVLEALRAAKASGRDRTALAASQRSARGLPGPGEGPPRPRREDDTTPDLARAALAYDDDGGKPAQSLAVPGSEGSTFQLPDESADAFPRLPTDSSSWGDSG